VRKLSQRVTFLACIREVSGSKLGLYSDDHDDDFCRLS
jgi:hypothetical protein